MTKIYRGLMIALPAIAVFAAGCDQVMGTDSGPTPAAEAPPAEVAVPAEQPAAEVEPGMGFNLATAQGREAAKSALGEGWYDIEEPGHVWQAANDADLTLTVPAGTERTVTLYLSSFLPNPGMELDVNVTLDDQEPQSVSMQYGESDEVVTLDLPASEESSTHTVTFNVSELYSPSEEIEGNTDERELGVALTRVAIEAN